MVDPVRIDYRQPRATMLFPRIPIRDDGLMLALRQA
jgi:hypothetical protein